VRNDPNGPQLSIQYETASPISAKRTDWATVQSVRNGLNGEVEIDGGPRGDFEAKTAEKSSRPVIRYIDYIESTI
jgi:hypothetical protein